jgi:hypothetical protein
LRILLITLFCFFLIACSKEKEIVRTVQPVKTATTTPVSTTHTRAPAIDEEPPEKVLSALMFKQYAQLEAQGGLPATVTASGKSGIIHAKLYSVTKDKCHQSPVIPEGMYQCNVALMGTMWWEGQREPTKPLSDAKRILVIKDADGAWIDCTYAGNTKGICSTGIKR